MDKNNSSFWEIEGNLWCKFNYTYEQALAASKTLVNCRKCTDCSYCTDCVLCNSCTNCIGGERIYYGTDWCTKDGVLSTNGITKAALIRTAEGYKFPTVSNEILKTLEVI